MNYPESRLLATCAQQLRIRCVGRFGVENALGGEIHVRTRKMRGLLAYVALSHGSTSREQIAGLLWSERGQEQARSSVRHAIFELRQIVPDALITCKNGSVALSPEVSSDLRLIRDAAEQAAYAEIHNLLACGGRGLLADLDGLDPEFDSWLRMQRANEPAGTFEAALAAARQAFERSAPDAAKAIVAEVRRLDPTCENAARLQLMIDHRLGDVSALHRHYQQLNDALREEYAAEPSEDTELLMRQLKPRLRRALEAPATPASSFHGRRTPETECLRVRGKRGRVAALAAGLTPVLILLLWGNAWLSGRASKAEGTPLIAVLPFDRQAATDAFLAEGLSDDTRTALSQNRALRVLGRTTAASLAERRLEPSEYDKRLGVDFLVDGSIRRIGDRVRVTVSLTRTSDGVAIWDGAFSGRLGDPLALQEAIATAIEGRIRGLLARGGGTRADQIGTAPGVYILYSQARALVRERSGDKAARAAVLLRRAVTLDPNFAPAWSSLGAAEYFIENSSPVPDSRRLSEASAHVQRALVLAPRLSEAHATKALIGGVNSPAAEAMLQKAVALDPSNTEAWNWLAVARERQFRIHESIAALRRAVETDPLWSISAENLAGTLAELGQVEDARKVVALVERAGARKRLIARMRARIATHTGDYSAAVAMLISAREAGELDATDFAYASGPLFRMGLVEEAARARKLPAWLGPALRSEIIPPAAMTTVRPRLREFWANSYFNSIAARAMVNLGRSRDLARGFQQAFSGDDFVTFATENGTLDLTAPTLAVALRTSGEEAKARYLLAASAERLETFRRRAPSHRELLWRLARVRAAQGHRVEALRLLRQAVVLGWLPDGFHCTLDLVNEPGFRGLSGDPRFEVMRRHVLRHIARERAELGPVTV